MAKDTKRSRGSKWSHEHTLVLAELKWDAFLNKEEGRIAWKQIAQTISSRFPDQIRSADQCEGRWDTLVKVYKQIEEYCIVTGQEHWQLNVDELASMKLATAYRQDWYIVLKQVCSQRKRKERCDCDQVAGKMSKGSNTGSHSDLLPEPTTVRDTQRLSPPAATPASTSESATARLDAEPSFEVEKLSPEEEIQQDQCKVGIEDSAEWDAKWADAMVVTPEIEQAERGSEQTVPRDLARECPSHDQQCGAVNVAGGMGYDLEDILSDTPWNMNDSNNMEMYLSQHMAEMSLESTVSTTSRSPDSTVSEVVISRQSSGCNKIIQGLDTNSDLQSVSKEEQQSQQCALKVIELGVILCCDACIRRLRRKLEEMAGIKKPVNFDQHNMKVSVTATAEPEDVLKLVRMVKKTAVLWPQKK